MLAIVEKKSLGGGGRGVGEAGGGRGRGGEAPNISQKSSHCSISVRSIIPRSDNKKKLSALSEKRPQNVNHFKNCIVISLLGLLNKEEII
jgi:hypothetical protein